MCRQCLENFYTAAIETSIQPYVTSFLAIETIEGLRAFASETNHTTQGDLATQRADRIQSALLPLLSHTEGTAHLYQHHVARSFASTRTNMQPEHVLLLAACCESAIVTASAAPSVLNGLSSFFAYVMAALCVFALLWGWQTSYQKTHPQVTTSSKGIPSSADTPEVATTVAATPVPLSTPQKDPVAAARSIQSTWRRQRATPEPRAPHPYATTPVPREVDISEGGDSSHDDSLPDIMLSPQVDKQVVKRGGWMSWTTTSIIILLLAMGVAAFVGTNESPMTTRGVSDTVWSTTKEMTRGIAIPDDVWSTVRNHEYTVSATNMVDELWAKYVPDEWYPATKQPPPPIIKKKSFSSDPSQLGGSYGPILPFGNRRNKVKK